MGPVAVCLKDKVIYFIEKIILESLFDVEPDEKLNILEIVIAGKANVNFVNIKTRT